MDIIIFKNGGLKMDLLFSLFITFCLLIIVMAIINRKLWYIIFSFLLIFNLIAMCYVGYLNCKYSLSNSLFEISVEFRKKYLEIETLINDDPSYENIDKINDWNKEVLNMQNEFNKWTWRNEFDWREINPIKLTDEEIEGLHSGIMILDNYAAYTIETS